MEELVYITNLIALLLVTVTPVQGQEFCEGKTFWCDKGHCCGKGKCCAYYYELWWFWLIWALIILLSCCCLYQQKRFRHRRQTTRRGSRSRPRNRSRIVQALDAAFITPIFDPDRVRLPTYDEAKDMPKDPPPYNMLYETRLPETAVAGQPRTHSATQVVAPRHINDAPQASLIDNEEQSGVAVNADTWREPPPPYTPTSPLPLPTSHPDAHDPSRNTASKQPCSPTPSAAISSNTSVPPSLSLPIPNLTLPVAANQAPTSIRAPTSMGSPASWQAFSPSSIHTQVQSSDSPTLFSSTPTYPIPTSPTPTSPTPTSPSPKSATPTSSMPTSTKSTPDPVPSSAVTTPTSSASNS